MVRLRCALLLLYVAALTACITTHPLAPTPPDEDPVPYHYRESARIRAKSRINSYVGLRGGAQLPFLAPFLQVLYSFKQVRPRLTALPRGAAPSSAKGRALLAVGEVLAIMESTTDLPVDLDWAARDLLAAAPELARPDMTFGEFYAAVTGLLVRAAEGNSRLRKTLKDELVGDWGRNAPLVLPAERGVHAALADHFSRAMGDDRPTTKTPPRYLLFGVDPLGPAVESPPYFDLAAPIPFTPRRVYELMGVLLVGEGGCSLLLQRLLRWARFAGEDVAIFDREADVLTFVRRQAPAARPAALLYRFNVNVVQRTVTLSEKLGRKMPLLRKRPWARKRAAERAGGSAADSAELFPPKRRREEGCVRRDCSPKLEPLLPEVTSVVGKDPSLVRRGSSPSPGSRPSTPTPSIAPASTVGDALDAKVMRKFELVAAAERRIDESGQAERLPTATFAAFLRHKHGHTAFRPVLRALFFACIVRRDCILSIHAASASELRAVLTRVEDRLGLSLHHGSLAIAPALLEEYREMARSVFLAHYLSSAPGVPLELYLRAVVARAERADPRDWPDRSFCERSLYRAMHLLADYLHRGSPAQDPRVCCALAARLAQLVAERFGAPTAQYGWVLDRCPAATAPAVGEGWAGLRAALAREERLRPLEDTLGHLDRLSFDNAFMEDVRATEQLEAAYRGYCENAYGFEVSLA